MARYQHPFAMSMGLHPKFEKKIFFEMTSTGSITKSSIIIDLQYLTIRMNDIRMEQKYHLYTTLLSKFQVQVGLIYIIVTFQKY